MHTQFILKGRMVFLVCLLAISLTGCGNEAVTEVPSPEGTPMSSAAPTPEPSAEATPKPVYDFSDVELPPGFLEPLTFENSRGGDTAEAVLEQEGGPGQRILLVKPAVELLGVPFQAEFVFQAREDGRMTLQDADYLRDLYLDFRDPMPTLEQMTQEFDLLYAYFQQLWGEPEKTLFHFIEPQEDGTKRMYAEDVADFDNFLDSSAIGANAVWRLSMDDGSSWFYRLEMTTKGMLSVNKTSLYDAGN